MSMQSWMIVATVAATVIAAAPVAATAGTFATLYTFTGGADGGFPAGPLLYQDGNLYGTTHSWMSGNGNVFEVNAVQGGFQVIHSFAGGSDGKNAGNGVIYHNGTLYGTTYLGGGGCANQGGCGTIFSIDAVTGAEAVLYSFSQGQVQGPAGAGELSFQSGKLFGTTTYNGDNDSGTVFSFNPAKGSYKTLYDFGGHVNGKAPGPQLIYENGLFYGTTMYGGTGTGCQLFGGCGVVFAINPSTGAESLLHAFIRIDGALPFSNLAYHAGSLIGATDIGGSKSCKRGCGVSYKIKATTGHEKVFEQFQNEGEKYSGITVVNGNAYETVPSGGSGYGELIEVNLKSGQQTVLYTFTGGADGSDPVAPLTYHEGAFYGSTDGGNGTIFKLTP